MKLHYFFYFAAFIWALVDIAGIAMAANNYCLPLAYTLVVTGAAFGLINFVLGIFSQTRMDNDDDAKH